MREMPPDLTFEDRLVQDEAHPTEGDVAGKINMGVGGINACAICRRW